MNNSILSPGKIGCEQVHRQTFSQRLFMRMVRLADQPMVTGIDGRGELTDFVSSHATDIRALVAEHGLVLLRGFNVLDGGGLDEVMTLLVMPESLCIPSSSVCKHWKRVGVVDATRATLSGHRRFDRFRRQVFGANLVWRARHHLHRRQYAGLNQTAYHVTCDAQRCCRFGQGQPFAILFRRSVGMDTAHAAN
jgi:hypothetical protein